MSSEEKAKDNVTALAIRPDATPAAWRQTTDIAGVVRDLVLSLTIKIGDRRYLPVVGYQAIANGYGCVGSCSKVERVEGGWLATGEVRRMSDGAVIATGFGFAGDDEKASWAKAEFSRMSMSQTRSIGRACRSAFAFIVPIIDKGLETCSAEEMPSVEGSVVDRAALPAGKSRTESLKDRVKAVVGTNVKRPTPPQDVPPMSDFSDEEQPPEEEMSEEQDDSGFVFPFGRNKGEPLSRVNVDSLAFGVKTLTASVADPGKAQYRESNEALLAAIKRELARRNR